MIYINIQFVFYREFHILFGNVRKTVKSYYDIVMQTADSLTLNINLLGVIWIYLK